MKRGLRHKLQFDFKQFLLKKKHLFKDIKNILSKIKLFTLITYFKKILYPNMQ